MKIINFLLTVLPSVFWGLVIFGFEEPCLAIATLLCALIHEIGHLIFAPRGKLRAALSGFRIRNSGVGSYKEKLLTYIGGPLANVAIAIVLVLISPLSSGYLMMMAIINIATAVSNLLPIEGYDGYGIAITIIEMLEMDRRFYKALGIISNTLILFLCVFSLYLIDRRGGGYWIFAIFFTLMIKGINRDISRAFSRFHEI